MNTKLDWKQKRGITLNDFKQTARIVFYGLLLMGILAVIQALVILSIAAGMSWLNVIWIALFIVGIIFAIIVNTRR
jgi:hypothetical protein